MNDTYHLPVLLKESVDGLAIKPDGIYVDLTFGGGGHTKFILDQLETGHLYSFDQDADAAKNQALIDDDKFTFIQGNFRFLKKYLKAFGVKEVDGILADLGISSHQIDTPERGFSHRYEAELDMRMSQSGDLSARKVVNEYAEEELHKILGAYGEVRNARTLAKAIVVARINQPIKTINDLKEVMKSLAPRGKENRYYSQVFQALRIEVNDEMKALEEMIEQSTDMLKEGGRFSVISYHSLEDRLVKTYINKGVFYGEPERDMYGNFPKPLEAVTRKPIEASPEEVANNNRARSAKLRIAIKNSGE